MELKNLEYKKPLSKLLKEVLYSGKGILLILSCSYYINIYTTYTKNIQ